MFSLKPIHLAVAAALAASPAWAEEPLTEDSTITAPVVVTATRVEQNSFDLPLSIDVVDGETIREGQPQINLSETAVRIPGVVVSNRNNLAQDLAISTRGFGARSAFGVRGVRLYADGIPMSMPDGQGQTGTFNLDTAQRIEFLRGPFSSLYGNSSGGVVQIFTKDGSPRPTLSGKITLGSYSTHRESVTFDGREGDFDYVLNAASMRSDGFRDNSDGGRDTLHAKLGFKLSEDTKITLVATALDQPETHDPQGLTLQEFRDDPRLASPNSETFNTRVSRDHQQLGMTLEHKLNEENTLRAMAYFGQRDNLQYLSTPIGAQNNPLNSGGVAEIAREFGGMDARWTHQAKLADQPFSLTAGLSYDFMEDERKGYENFVGGTGNVCNASGRVCGVKGQLRRDEDNNEFNFDQYLQATWEPTDRWLLTGGLRHTKVRIELEDHYIVGANLDDSGAATYKDTTGAIGATFKLTPALNVYANYGEGFETPTFIEMAYSTTGGANLTLSPSHSKHYEMGIKAFVLDNTRINLALFKVDTEKEIVVDSTTGGRASYKNAGDTERRGMELSLDSVLPHNFKFYAAYTLMNAEFSDAFTSGATTVDSGNRIPGTYTSSTYAELSWKHPASGFTTAIEGIHNSKAYTNDTNTDSADAYTIFNWYGGFSQEHNAWKFSEFLRVDNISDRKYVSSIRVNDANDRFYEPGAFRSWLIGINASYQF